MVRNTIDEVQRKMGRREGWKMFRKQLPLQLFVLSGIVFLLIFNYIPMFGILIAFKKYDISTGVVGIFTSEWVGLKYFKEFVTDYNFFDLVKNTAGLSLVKLVFSFPAPIIFAIMLGEIHHMKFKKLVQSCSYLPHFISWVIVAGISFQFLSSGGVINVLLEKVGLINKPISFLTDASKFWGLVTALDIWKEMGWSAIIFLAAITGINPELFEAAQIDGASRLQRIRYITLPSIKPSIAILLVLTMGSLFSGNFDQCFMLGNDMNRAASQILPTYIFRVGLAQGRYSFATAAGLFQSTISLIIVFLSNFFSKKIANTSLF